MVAPQRSWHGATYVLSPGAEQYDYTWPLPNGATAATQAGERGRLIAISEGRGGAGFGSASGADGGPPLVVVHRRRTRTC